MRSASYDVDVAKEYGIPAAILLNKLLYLQQYSKRKDGFCWRSSAELSDELALSDRQLRKATSALEGAGVIETKVTYIDGTLTKCKHYHIIDGDALKTAFHIRPQRPNLDSYTVNESDSYTVNESIYRNNQTIEVKHSRESASRFAPPSVQEVRDYSESIDKPIDPDAFVDYYASKGWKVGTSSMKDWHAAVRQWYRRDAERGTVYSPPMTDEQRAKRAAKKRERQIAEYWLSHPDEAASQGIDLAEFEGVV